jgi:polyisoprenoid-binding protein YceI
MVKRLLIAAIVAIVLVIGGAVVYVVFIRSDAPAPLTFTDEDPDDDSTTATTGGEPLDEVDGVWIVAEGTEVGYRVIESFGGALETEAAGRTTAVDGSLTISGTTVSEASFTADLTTVESDDPSRDRQFNGRIMDTAQFPEATFTTTAHIDFGAVPTGGEALTAEATGELTLRGVTREVTFEVQAKTVGDHVEVLASIPIVFADYDIPNPSNLAVTTRDEGTLEVLLVLTPSP